MTRDLCTCLLLGLSAFFFRQSGSRCSAYVIGCLIAWYEHDQKWSTCVQEFGGAFKCNKFKHSKWQLYLEANNAFFYSGCVYYICIFLLVCLISVGSEDVWVSLASVLCMKGLVLVESPDCLTRNMKLHCCESVDCFHICRPLKGNLCCSVKRRQVSKKKKNLCTTTLK